MGVDLGESGGSEQLEALNRLAREARDGIADPSPAERSAGWARVAARLGPRGSRRSPLFRYTTAGLLTAATVAAVIALFPALRQGLRSAPPVLTYEIRGGSVVEGGYLREAGREGIKLRFAEGTEMSFNAGTRGRLRAVGRTGARVAIEHGKASFNVIPRHDADWSVEVGPFLVTVKGTVFTVAWDAVTERFDLVLERGQVAVAGPISNGTVLLKGGQRLAVDLPRKQTVITEANPDGSWPATKLPSEKPLGLDGDTTETRAPSAPDSARRPSLVPPAGERAPAEARSDTRRDWAGAVAAGDWDRILADVDRLGTRRTLAQASSEDLLTLADAARYRRRAELARAALLAERRRFPASTAALDAAYLLGRLSEAGHGGTDEALQWYETYLAGAPAGHYASEALGRKMMATNQLRGAAAARALAQEYLRRFSGGSYAGAARALLDSAP